MIEALQQGAWRALPTLLVLVPVLLLVPSKERLAWLGVAIASVVTGALLWWMPFVDGAALKLSVLRGNTLLACALLIAAFALGMTHLAERAEFHPWARRALIGVFFVPLFVLDGVALADQLRQIAFLKTSVVPYIMGMLPIAIAFAAAVPLVKLTERVGARRFLAWWSVALYLIAVRAVFEAYLMSSLEGIIARAMHDGVHAVIMLTLLPDHPFLTGLLFNLIGLTFAKGTSILLNVLLFGGAAALLMATTYFAPLPVHAGMKVAERRSAWAAERRRRWAVAVPAAIALVMLSGLAVRAATFQGKPVAPEREELTVVTDASGSSVGQIDPATLADQKLHVYTYDSGGTQIRLIATQLPNGRPVVCLDACLVCAPDGYAQLGKDLFCLYCGTPIPIDTVGQPGGCNPVPVQATSRDNKLYVDVDKAVDLWTQVTRGK